MKRNSIIAAAALVVAGAAATYFIRKKYSGVKSEPRGSEPSGAESPTNGRKGTKHQTQAFSRARHTAGRNDDIDII